MLVQAYSLRMNECYVIALKAGKDKGLFLQNDEWGSRVASVQPSVRRLER